MIVEFDPSAWPRFLELPGFSRAWDRLGLGDDGLRALQSAILEAPGGHPVIPGTGGLRKVRFAVPGQGRGKRGAYRVCYAGFLAHGVIVLAMVYDKGERADLTSTQKKAVAALLREIEDTLRRGLIG